VKESILWQTTRMRKTRKQQKTIRHKGGRFLGKGGFGCSYGFPPLPCMDPNGGLSIRRSSEQISKIMGAKEAGDELIKNRLFRTIDPTQKYFISATDGDQCIPDLTATEASDQLDKCPLNPGGPLQLVFFDYGGTDLDKLTLTAKEYAPFFKSLYNVFEGLALAHANGIVHHDLKPSNIVTQLLPTGEFQTRVIDYDFAFDVNHIGPADLNHLQRNYIFFPFEVRFLNPQVDRYYFPKANMLAPVLTHALYQIKVQLHQIIVDWFQQFPQPYIKGFIFGDGQLRAPTGHQQVGANQYYKDYAPSLSVLRTKPKDYLKSIDVYMMGYTLGLLLNKFFSCIMYCEDLATKKFNFTFKFSTPQVTAYSYPEDITKRGFPPETESWLRTVRDFVLAPYAELVEEMTTWDLTRRITMEDARIKYGRLLIVMDVFFSEYHITTHLAAMGGVKVKAQPVLPYVPSPTDLTKIQVSAVPEPVNRPYNPPPTNLSKIQTNLFKGGRSRRRKTQKKRGRKYSPMLNLRGPLA